MYYGYPRCCIDAFCRLDHIREEATTGDELCSQVGNSTGFIPCRNCAEKIHRGELTLKDLIQGRKSPLIFPHCEDEDNDRIYDMVEA